MSIGLPKGMNREHAYIAGIQDREDEIIGLLHEHHPSLTDANEEEITASVFAIVGESLTFNGRPGEETDVASLAIRTCACGLRIDGFDEYVFHLGEVFGG